MLTVDKINSYYGQAHILTDVSFKLKAGETVALLGRNGAGKSTTIKTIMGLVRARTGKITFLDDDITRAPPHQVAKRGLGYVPEERRVFTHLTVMENLEAGRKPAIADTAPWTPERLFDIFPNLARMRDRPGGAMSGGEQQMLTIARTLMGNPALLLLDEPSEGLAPVIVEQIGSMIAELKKANLSILLCEQNLHFASSVSDRALIVEKGALRHDGPMKALMKDEKTRRAYLSV
jgi:branched-chain amino acid transport system ATP-binding protein